MHHHLGKIVDDPRIRQVLIALGPFILTIVMGMSEAYSAIMLPQLQHPNSSIKIDRELASWIASMAALPMAAGSFSGGYLMDKIGRRAIHIWGSVPLILGWFVIAAADSSTFILIGRFLTGLSDGILGAPPNVYIAETSHPSIRGVLMISTSATVVFGILFVHVLGTFLSWKLTALICGLIPIPFVIFMCFTPESPTFLARKKKYEEASKAFLWCRGTSMESLKELDELLGRQRTINDASENNIMKQIKNLSQPEVWKPLVIICVFFFTAQISGNTVIAAYTIDILEECGLSGDVFNAYFAMIVMDVFRLISSIASLVFVKTMKRRTLAMLSGYGVCASLFLLCGYSYIAPKMGISSTIFPMICLVCYVCFIAVGIQPLSWTMMGEIFPIAYRGVGTGLASLTCYLFFFAVVQTFPYLLVVFGNIFAVFIFYGVCTGFGTVFLHVFLPETKDKPLHVIEDHFKSQKKEKQIISMVDINSVE
ncbi:hypothetical protein HHI36_002649 [Cryptolaemus montrouzieri]|uniref:Major facilitator superfamily (MFS) profile domain-containing protein n=1 Tax=Cryptolaemus montrouzieri TaxID=559131 RepID=A0ABD2PB33_9CUCU